MSIEEPISRKHADLLRRKSILFLIFKENRKQAYTLKSMEQTILNIEYDTLSKLDIF